MISALFEVFFGIIKFIWDAPTWAVVAVIVIFCILHFIGRLFGLFDGSDSSESGEHEGGSDSDREYPNDSSLIQFDKPEQPFAFYDYNGDRRGRGDCFYDSKGYRCSWGGGFYDGKGYYRSWGEAFYDARGFYRSWGDPFYDTQGDLVYPNW